MPKATITNNGRALYTSPRVGDDDLILAPGESGSGEFSDYVYDLMVGARNIDVEDDDGVEKPKRGRPPIR